MTNQKLLINVFLIISGFDPTISIPDTAVCTNNGSMRLTGGSNSMEGRVQVCLLHTWSRVCGHLDLEGRNIICKQMGYLWSSTTMKPGSTTFGIVQCDSGQLMDRIDCLGFEGTLLECSHQIIPSTNSTGACVCSRNAVVRCIEGVPPTDLQVHYNSESMIVTLTWKPPKARSSTNGLTPDGYTVTCITLPDHEHSVQVRVSDDTLNTTVTGLQLAALDYECCVAADYPNYHPRVCENTTELVLPTELNIKQGDQSTQPDVTLQPSTAEDVSTITTAFPMPASSSSLSVVGGVMGALVVLLLAMLCGSIVYHNRPVKVKPKWMRNRLHLQETPGGKELDSLPRQLSNSDVHTYETVDWSRRNSSATNKTSDEKSLDYHGNRQLKDLKLLTREEQSGQYEIAEVQQIHEENSCGVPSTMDKATPLGDRYEFAQPNEQQTTSLEFDIYSSTENLALTGNNSNKASTETRKGYYDVCIPDLDSSESHQTSNKTLEMNGYGTKSYINVHFTDTDSGVHHGYSHLDLLDSDVNCNNSYSHIHLAETDSNHTHSRSELNSNTSHSYSHINTMDRELVSSGYFHLDTNKPDTSNGTSPTSGGKRASARCKRETPYGTLGNGKITTTKSYSQLDIGQMETLQVHLTNQLQIQGEERGRGQDIPSTEREPPTFRVPVITLGGTVSHLDMLAARCSQQEVSKGYSSLDIGESQSTKGYSHLDITEMHSSSEQICEDSCGNKGYSHLDIEQVCHEDDAYI